jgi:PAS domain S-box-containing protein
MGSLGDLGLNAIRETALRAGRLAEALFDASEGDVIAVNDGRVWRGKGDSPTLNDANAARVVALGSDEPVWVADTREAAGWRDHPAVKAEGGIRFCASAPIRLRDGSRLGVLRVLDNKPRPYDPKLAERLQDLAAMVAEEGDRYLGGETRMIRDLFNRAPGLMVVTRGPAHVLELVNPAFQRFVGDVELIGRPVAEALPSVGDQGFVAVLDAVYATGKAQGGYARRVVIPARATTPEREAYIDFIFQPFRDAAGEVTGVFFQGHDVTAARRAADELAASRREVENALAAVQTVIEQSLDVICMVDAEGRFQNMSPRAESLWGYAPSEMIGRPPSDFLHPDDIEATYAAAVAIQRGQPTTSFTNRILHRDGTPIPMTWTAVWSESHAMTFCIGRDMREREAAELKLREAQKMEALGRLTGGVAHDFNNLLTVVIGGSETLADALADEPELQAIAKLVLDTAENGAALVARLLAFSRRQELSPQVMDAARLFRTLRPILERTLGADIEIAVEADTTLRWLADPTQLTSAMLNLCLNGRDAMPSGGRLTLGVRCVPGDGRTGARRFVELSVEDTGHGMAPATIQRVLEPFFTTKPVGKGSGLGLSMAYGFAQQSDGRLSIESAPGAGTKVSLFLPATDEPLPAEDPTLDARAAAAARRILVVEDDPAVRTQQVRQLEELGYRVHACAEGPEALRWLAEEDGEADLLMTDMVMPGGMNGRQLANYVRAILPDLPILFTSGHSDDAQLRAARLLARSGFLAKPYRRAELAQAIETAFDA